MKKYEPSNSIFNPLDFPIIFVQPLRLDSTSAWIEHIPLGMFIIDLLRPKVLVELGTHTGVSYSAFCQAVKELNIDTKCYAVDTWKGDAHAGFYGEQILTDLRAFHDIHYCEFSKLIQNTFDDTAKYFLDGSIDLLHLDGLHSYDAVKHDFETWLPKMSKKGVVLFHDICEREHDFGVWKLWEELQVDYPSFAFSHGHGLGVLAVGSKYPSTLDLLLKSNEDAPKIREFFYLLGSRLEEGQKLIDQNRVIQNLTGELSQAKAEHDRVIQNLKGELSQTKAEVLEYALSRSWCLTRPLRKFKKLIRGKNA